MKAVRPGFPFALLFIIGLLAAGRVSASETAGGDSAAPPHRLAMELAREGDAAGSALEYRRLALASDDSRDRAGWHLAAAWSYLDAETPERAERQLDAVEASGRDAAAPVLVLRARAAEALRQPSTAAYFWQAALAAPEPDARRFAARRLAALRIREHNREDAESALRASGGDETSALEAVDRWANAARRSPRIGGLLGLVPGLGYAYSGEYANAARSAILNGLFLWIMARCADDDEWGVFALAAFFEFTWYSGSIYGGIDAAHRHNRRIDQRAEREILGDTDMQLDPGPLPLIRFNYRF